MNGPLLVKSIPMILGIIMTKNKAGYTAIPVVCGWAGAVIEVTRSVKPTTAKTQKK